MKKESIVIFSLFLTFQAFSQVKYEQIRIPLDNSKGVPFRKVEGTYMLGGFEVDNNNSFYFLGGNMATLAVFKAGKLVNIKRYKEFEAGNLYLDGDKIYSFDYLFKATDKKYKNNLVVLNKSDGTLNTIYGHITDGAVNSYRFINHSLILDKSTDSKNSAEIYSFKYDFSGKLLTRIENGFDLPIQFFPKSYSDEGVFFLGLWNNCYVYGVYTESGKVKFWILDAHGTKKYLKDIDARLLGKSFIETPNEFIKIRNGFIYIAGHEKNNVVITIISIKDLL